MTGRRSDNRRWLAPLRMIETVVDQDLHKLRIDKAHKARRDERSLWPWALVVLILAAAGAGLWQWRAAAAAPVVRTVRVRLPEPGAAQPDQVALNATGYVIAAHKIELA